MRELGRGKYSDCFKVSGKRGYAVCLKLSYYQEDTIRAFSQHVQHGNREAAHVAKDQDAISVSVAMAEVAKQMKVHGVSPHFVKVYCEADVKYLPLRLKAFLGERIPTLSEKQLKYSHVCLMELYSCNLTTFLSQRVVHDETLKPLLFQILYTLACLQVVFPGFRHNDLSSNNVLVKPAKYMCILYNFAGRKFYIKSRLTAAMADFDFTHVPGHAVLSNERVLSGKYNVNPGVNDAYDAHLLLKSVYRCLKQRNMCPHTRDFLKTLDLDPANDRVSYTMHHVSPMALLKHSFFHCLQKKHTYQKCYCMPD